MMSLDPLYNPWHVNRIKEFMYINCPECVYKTKDEPSFEAHAIQNHPQAHVLFHTSVKNEFLDFDSIVKEEHLDFTVNYIPQKGEEELPIKDEIEHVQIKGENVTEIDDSEQETGINVPEILNGMSLK